MAVAYVRDTGLGVSANFSGTTTKSFLALPAVGNHVFAGIALYQSTNNPAIAAVTDNQSGNTYVENVETEAAGSADCSATIYSVKVVGSTGTFTLTADPDAASNNYIAWAGVEFSGLNATTHLDRTGVNSSTSSAGDATVTASLANTTNNGVALAVASVSNGDTDINIGDTPPAGYTNVIVNEDSETYVGFSLAYKIYSGSETSSAPFTHDNVSQSGWAAVIATYKEASVAGATSPGWAGGGWW